jgi:hypothetical protein
MYMYMYCMSHLSFQVSRVRDLSQFEQLETVVVLVTDLVSVSVSVLVSF